MARTHSLPFAWQFYGFIDLCFSLALESFLLIWLNGNFPLWYLKLSSYANKFTLINSMDRGWWLHKFSYNMKILFSASTTTTKTAKSFKRSSINRQPKLGKVLTKKFSIDISWISFVHVKYYTYISMKMIFLDSLFQYFAGMVWWSWKEISQQITCA